VILGDAAPELRVYFGNTLSIFLMIRSARIAAEHYVCVIARTVFDLAEWIHVDMAAELASSSAVRVLLNMMRQNFHSPSACLLTIQRFFKLTFSTPPPDLDVRVQVTVARANPHCPAVSTSS
jgi:hypothetical protein